MNLLKATGFLTLILVITSSSVIPSWSQQPSSRASLGLVNPESETDILREKIADQIFLYKEVMQHISDISESFSFGYNTPDEALKRLIVLRHAYNSKSEPLRPEIVKFNELINQMFSRLENYFIHFKSIYREDPYLNSKIAETKFYAAQEAERLENMYLR
jgi:hypothetical protein